MQLTTQLGLVRPVNQDLQTDVITFLADPATHGLGAGKVTRVRTHVADVFLAGHRAYKIKRAVRYSFVDFTMLESRRAACVSEVRLNARTAPEIYLGVSAVRRAGDGKLILDEPGGTGGGEAIEWVVVMRRFDEHDILHHLAERGELQPEHVDDLTDAVLELHASAEVRGAPYGGARGLARVIDETAGDMASLPRAFAPDRVEALVAAQREALTATAGLLDARRDTGQVRRCHGDLHLGNAVLRRGRPTLFDCIEFSDEIATIDLFYDFAFLLMDLDVRGLRRLANRALARYLGRWGHPEVLAALPLMLALRAAVRAKVNALGIEGQPDRREARRLATEADRFMGSAEAFLAPAAPPHLIAIGGFSGTGKTSVAMGLAPSLGRPPGALVVRSDVIRKRLAGVPPEERLSPESYTAMASRRVYDTLAREAAAALAGGQSVVADAVFMKQDDRRLIESVARNANVEFYGFWLEAPLATLTTRVSARCRDASDATPKVVVRQVAGETGEITWTRINAATDESTALGALKQCVRSS